LTIEPEAHSESLEIQNPALLLALCGPRSELLGEVARESGTVVNLRGHTIYLSGDKGDVQVAHRFLSDAMALVDRGVTVLPTDVKRSLRSLREQPDRSLVDLLHGTIVIGSKRRTIVPKTPAQRAYIEAIQSHDLTFGIGPAGTGKTYLAMAVAAHLLLNKHVKRIILTRPAVEAGEKLGFLPGDLAEKVNPYLTPLYDALHDMLDFDRVEQMRERGQIEVAPLAFMRGRTLGDAFVIVDEAQNATAMQMKMLLTRLGVNSKMVITGDKTQVDLPKREDSGLVQVERILPGIDGIAFHYFNESDVVRHRLVREIVKAYAADAGE